MRKQRIECVPCNQNEPECHQQLYCQDRENLANELVAYSNRLHPNVCATGLFFNVVHILQIKRK